VCVVLCVERYVVLHNVWRVCVVLCVERYVGLHNVWCVCVRTHTTRYAADEHIKNHSVVLTKHRTAP
jgi:hypothetical protein